MSDIYVTGHRNPDTDSIVAAIAYANLRQAMGDREYKAARLGAVADETKRLLDMFEVEAPMLIQNMRTQVRDLDYDHPPAFTASVTIDRAWEAVRDGRLNSVPIVNDDGTLYGILSVGDIANYNMSTMYTNRVDDLPLFNLLSVIEGTLVNEYLSEVTSVSGELFIAMPQSYEDPALTNPDSILICGNQPEIIDRAIEAGVKCLILCRADLKPAWAQAQNSCIISTPLSARRVARFLCQAIPVERICNTKDLIYFKLTDYLDDVREVMLKSRFRSYPIVDEKGVVVGTLSRYHMLRPRRKQVVLVDHNEATQSVPGLEQVEILEIIDHHRLGDIQTTTPIHVRNEPVGSTNTILATMYQERGVVPSPKIAGLMAGAILSDTVLFKSPTCTKRDIAMAERLAHIARVSLDELGSTLFSFDGGERSAEQLFRTDYKQFHISGQDIAVSQITCAGADTVMPRREEFLEVMRKEKADKGFDMVLLMITDVLSEGSHLLYVGSDDVIQQAFNTVPSENHLFLPGVMSRKKQIIAMLTALWG